MFVLGVWLTEIRDEDPVFAVCETSHVKLGDRLVLSREWGKGLLGLL